MKRYKAHIVGFKWSQKRPERYYPIFEYTDSYGESRQYIRRKGVERTPFTMDKTYRIIKTKDGTHESSERVLSFRFCMLIAKIFTFLIMLFSPKIGLTIALTTTLIIIGKNSWHIFRKHQNKKLVYQIVPSEGKIIEYRRFKPKNPFAKEKFVYRPLIQYKYDNNIYTHISTVELKDKTYKLNSNCYVFVDQKRQEVYDELELNLPLIDIDPLKKQIKEVVQDAKLGPTKVYVAKEIIKTPQIKEVSLSDTRPIHIPLRTEERVSSWY